MATISHSLLIKKVFPLIEKYTCSLGVNAEISDIYKGEHKTRAKQLSADATSLARKYCTSVVGLYIVR